MTVSPRVPYSGIPQVASTAEASFAAAKAICRRHARSFYFASHLLPPEKRQAAYAVYAFCRMIDDSVDDAGTDDIAAARLAAFGRRLDAIYDGGAAPSGAPREASGVIDEPALDAFARTVNRYQIPKQHFVDLAEGCRMDLSVSRYPDWPSLQRYCYHVAGVVGLIMSRVFGLEDERAAGQAVLMGNAMQLTNILRDVGEDWQRGRIYLPREDMDRFGYREEDLAAGVADERFRSLMRFEIERARDLFRRGAEGLCRLPADGSRGTAAAMAVIYSGILGAIERRDYDVFRGRAHLTTFQKLLRLPAARRLARRRDGEAVPGVF